MTEADPKACVSCLASVDAAAAAALEFEEHLAHHDHISRPCKTCWRLLEGLRRANHDRLNVLADHHSPSFPHHEHGAVEYMAEALLFHDFARPPAVASRHPRWRRILGV